MLELVLFDDLMDIKVGESSKWLFDNLFCVDENFIVFLWVVDF